MAAEQLLLGDAGQRRQIRGNAVLARDAPRASADEPAGADPRFADPTVDSIQIDRGSATKLRIVGRWLPIGIREPTRQLAHESGITQIAIRRGPAKRFADHVLRSDLGAEQVRRDPGDLGPLLVEGSRAGQRGGCSDTLKPIGLEAVTDPPHQHGHVAALATPVGVQLVEHEEPQSLGRLE